MRADYTTIGGLRDALATLDPTLAVYIDNRPPTALSSYRGYYEQLAIERAEVRHEATSIDKPGDPFDINLPGWGAYSPGVGEVKIKADPTVADLIEALNLADGARFEGYKGGQYTMHAYSDLWVSEYSQCDRRRITSVEVLPGRVDFTTTEEGW